MFILSPSRISAFLHSQDPERHFANADYRIAKGSYRGTGTMASNPACLPIANLGRIGRAGLELIAHSVC